MNDELGNRMKDQYENRTRYYLPRRTYTILRLDQKAAHTYTSGLGRPFDKDYIEDIDNAIIAMLPQIQGAVFAYTQSDEVSILLTDFATPQTDAWFDGNIQKMSSVAASIMTAEFNHLRLLKYQNEHGEIGHHMDDMYPPLAVKRPEFKLAYFDCRCFTVPDRTEVMNVFRWRQQDCVRNSVSMVAQHHFSPKELHGKSQSNMHEMLHNKGVNWATSFSEGEKNGRIIMKEEYEIPVSIPDPANFKVNTALVKRTRWISTGAWVFTKDEGKLLNMIPKYE